MRNKHLKELCKALCTKSDWKKEYKRLKQINDEMDKVYLQKGVDEKEYMIYNKYRGKNKLWQKKKEKKNKLS